MHQAATVKLVHEMDCVFLTKATGVALECSTYAGLRGISQHMSLAHCGVFRVRLSDGEFLATVACMFVMPLVSTLLSVLPPKGNRTEDSPSLLSLHGRQLGQPCSSSITIIGSRSINKAEQAAADAALRR